MRWWERLAERLGYRTAVGNAEQALLVIEREQTEADREAILRSIPRQREPEPPKES